MSGEAITAGGGTLAKSPGKVWIGVRSALFSAFGGILCGYDIGVIAGVQAMPNWLCTFGKIDPSTGQCGITSSQQSLVIATLPTGAFFGSLLAGPLADFVGRRWSIVIGAVVLIAGIAMQLAATALPLFYAGRVLGGWGIGIAFTLVLVYQSECSPKWIRGAVLTTYEWMSNVGSLIAAIINNATKDRQSRSSWQIPISIGFIWAFTLGVGMIIVPESPRWLMSKKRDKDAIRALSRLTSLPPDHPEIQAELEEIRLSLLQEEEMNKSSYLDCFRPSNNQTCFRTCTGILIPILLNLCGATFIYYYGTVFFLNSGIKKPFVITIITSTTTVVMTLPGLWGVQVFGRRKLLYVGSISTCICQFIVAIVGLTVSASNTTGQRILVAFVCIYLACFAFTWAPLSWVILGEIFPLNLRAKAASLALASSWVWNWAVGYSAPYLLNKQPGSAGLGVKVFFIWGTVCAGCVLFTYFCIPETKGLSLEQIDLLYQNTSPRHSVSYRRQLKRDGLELTFRGAQADQDTHSDTKEKV